MTVITSHRIASGRVSSPTNSSFRFEGFPGHIKQGFRITDYVSGLHRHSHLDHGTSGLWGGHQHIGTMSGEKGVHPQTTSTPPLQDHRRRFGKHVRTSDTWQTDLRRYTFTRLLPGTLACFSLPSDPSDVGTYVASVPCQTRLAHTYIGSHFDHSSPSLLLFRETTERQDGLACELTMLSFELPPVGVSPWECPHLVAHLSSSSGLKFRNI